MRHERQPDSQTGTQTYIQRERERERERDMIQDVPGGGGTHKAYALKQHTQNV